MKYILAVAVVILGLSSFGVKPISASAPTIEVGKVEFIEIINIGGFNYELPPNITTHTRRVLIDLIKCESGGNPKVINPQDTDGTASIGLLQFKPSTYKTAGGKDIMNGQEQLNVFLDWYGDGKSVYWWQHQFPACSQRHNYWLNI